MDRNAEGRALVSAFFTLWEMQRPTSLARGASSITVLHRAEETFAVRQPQPRLSATRNSMLHFSNLSLLPCSAARNLDVQEIPICGASPGWLPRHKPKLARTVLVTFTRRVQFRGGSCRTMNLEGRR